MRLINKIKIYFLVFTSVCVGFSCDSDLEYEDEKAFSEDLVWAEYDYIRRSMAAVYARVPKVQAHVDGAYLASATDDSDHSNESSDVARYNRGSWDMHNNPLDSWERNYRGIYLANEFIRNIDTVTLYNERFNETNYEAFLEDVERYKGEARFLKAYFHFELLKRYGGIPIMDEVSSIENGVDLPRNSYNEVVDYIAETCDSAMNYMPDYVSADVDYGTASDAAALALKSRAYLYAASELNNQSGTHDNYYDSCAVASAAIINMGHFQLENYGDLFTAMDGKQTKNLEVIFDFREGTSNDLEINNYPVGYDKGKGFTNPSQNLVDAYEMTDGTTFDWNDPVHAADPYLNRDARFYASIIYNGATVQGREVECYTGGLDAPGQTDFYGTKTGYYLKKGLNMDLDLVSDGKSKHYWFYFRYAEVLLNYAEAMNELYGPDSDPNAYGLTAREAINMVRTRAGQPDLSAVTAPDQDTFRERLRNERRVELAFEDHRFWDVRRWMIGNETLGATVKGVDVVKNEDDTFTYTVKDVENRVFEDKMNFFPIPYDEMRSTSNLTQTTGW
ncbi:RagB/SusD family nutrient uptake outer membrane protein [Marinifilum sp.]|uniref:RagB/SusD family nutrient uptake outer membrane protein n=1 Tax=Marinifilum sp. TaxID=2033137 RepID=UPI003BA8D7A7